MKTWLTTLMLLQLCSTAIATEIRVGREGYHTTLLLPVAAARDISPLPALPADTQWIRFGWGDRDYYGSADKSTAGAAKALLLPTESVMEVVALQTPEETTATVTLTASELARLKQYLHNSFRRDAAGQAQVLRTEANGFHYYAARGRYHLLRNCNHWTAKALHQAGQDVHWRRAVFAGSVIKQLH
ncbi:MAG: DUF2459 domain-containing protein [Moraxellaceae bacterium]|nr:DUF2459 domain-containing protein [Moraxellaceae bacterium]